MIRVIDIETTGIDPATDAVVEIASVDVKPGGVIANQQETLVCPPIPIPPEASAVHHLLDADVVSAPAFGDVIGDFAGADAYVAHNCSFERDFIGEHLVIAEKRPTWICTYKCALRLFPDAKGHSNQALRYQLGFDNPLGVDRKTLVPHRALADTIVTAAIFIDMLKRARWSQLVLWSSEPALHTRFSFGKHRGESYDAIAASDPSYLEWIIEKSDLDEGTKFSAAHALRRLEAA